MPPPTKRAEVLEGLRSQIRSGKPIVGAGAGIATLSLSSRQVAICADIKVLP